MRENPQGKLGNTLIRFIRPSDTFFKCMPRLFILEFPNSSRVMTLDWEFPRDRNGIPATHDDEICVR